MHPRFLVDENLSVALPTVAQERGYEASHINHRGLRCWKDWDILAVIEREDWVLVTNNAIEFRGRFRNQAIHPGVIFLLPCVARATQLELFSAALDEVDRDADLVNTALDVALENHTPVVRRYPLP